MISEGINEAVIFEDDVEFGYSLNNILSLIEKFPKNWEVILLGHHAAISRGIQTSSSFFRKTHIVDKYFLARPIEKGYGTYAYMINRNGALKLLQKLDKLSKPIDHYTGDSQYVNLYVVTPPVVKISHEMSEKHHSMHERTRLDMELKKQIQLGKPQNNSTLFIKINSFIRSFKRELRKFYMKMKPLKDYQ
jgi:GR25 family glycosyltransferase involved in LPS biosynthesis